MTKTMQLVLAVAMMTAAMAQAQQARIQPAVADGEATIQATVAAAPAEKQVNDDLFAGTEKFAKWASDVTEVNLDPSMMGMIPGGKSGGPDLARKMRFMVIHTYTYDKPGMYSMEDVAAYQKKLVDGTWSCSIHVRDKSGSTDICSRATSDHKGTEMVIIAAEPKELTFIHMSGQMSLDELSRMGGSTGNKRR